MFEGVLDTPPNSNNEKVAPYYQQKKNFFVAMLDFTGLHHTQGIFMSRSPI